MKLSTTCFGHCGPSSGDRYIYIYRERERDRERGEGTAVAQWLMCCATNRKVAGSTPDDAIAIFHCHRTMALGSTQK